MSRLGRLSVLVLALLIAAPAASPQSVRAADVLNVPGDFSTIQAAIDAAVAGDTVLVGPGTYVERLSIDEQITVESSEGPDDTIIDGNEEDTVVVMSLDSGESPEFRGFTVRNGEGSPGGPGGVLASGGSPLIENNVITENFSCSGGGIHAQASAATIRNNVLSDNKQVFCSGGAGGGGILLSDGGTVQVTNNVITGNQAASGGGIGLNGAGTPTISDNTILENTTTSGGGGGIGMLNDSSPVIVNNLIAGNTSTTVGGGIWVQPSATGLTIINNTIADNVAQAGSALRAHSQDTTSVIRNNVLVSATAEAAVWCEFDAGGIAAEFAHNDVWNSQGPAIDPACPSLIGSDGNVSLDPKFANALPADYHLRADSPVIDAGDNAGAPATDVDGEGRPHDGDEDGTPIVDIGFDEATQSVLIDRPRLNFGEVFEGVAASEIVTVSNFGGDPLGYTELFVDESDASDFAITDETCTDAPIAPGESCDVTIVFTPSSIGQVFGSWTLSGVDLPTYSSSLEGVGIESITVEPDSIAAPPTDLGQVVAAGTVTLTNHGNPATVTSASIGGANAADFTISNQTCTAAPIATDDDCTIDIQFGPKALGSRSATLTIQGPDPVGTRTVSLAGTGNPPASGITWGSISSAGPSYTWNAGGAFARTLQSTTQRLHVAYATDRVGGKWASNSGPYAGVYYVRSSNATSWSTPKRLNPSTQHAIRLGLAASSSRVYAVWVSQRNLTGNSPSSPRVLYFRANTNYGSSTAWGSTIRLSSTAGTVDYPTVAASGTDVHVAWTHAGNGEVRLSTSQNRGGTWTTRKISTTTATTSEGKAGVPSVAVSGSTVVVAWIADNAGTVKARVSTNRGTSWGSVVTLGSGANSFASTAVRGSRIAVAWTRIDGVVYRQRVSGAWGAPMLLADLSEVTDPIPYAPAVALQDTGRIGVTWSEQSLSSDDAPLRWIESANGGTSWFEPETAAGETSTRRLNDWASVVWVSPSTRYVVWNGWVAGTDTYHLYFRKGSGTPISPTSAAPTWEPVNGSNSRASVEKQFHLDLKGPDRPDRR